MAKIRKGGIGSTGKTTAPKAPKATAKATPKATGKAKKSAPKSFEPSKKLMNEKARQTAPKKGATRQVDIKMQAGLKGRQDKQIGPAVNKARQSLDKLGEQMNWRLNRMDQKPIDTKRLMDQLTQPPAIQAAYGAPVRPGDDLFGPDGPGKKFAPPTQPTQPTQPMQPMYGAPVRPGDGGIGLGELPTDPWSQKPIFPKMEIPPMQQMYGLPIRPGDGGGLGGIDLPKAQPLYGATLPNEQLKPELLFKGRPTMLSLADALGKFN